MQLLFEDKLQLYNCYVEHFTACVHVQDATRICGVCVYFTDHFNVFVSTNC